MEEVSENSSSVEGKRIREQAPKFRSNMLMWPVDRVKQTFRVYVVEPREYDAKKHGEIFNAALTSLATPAVSRLESVVFEPAPVAPDSFDLVTFPEAFLPADILLSTLHTIPQLGSFGCVHVGLRPSPCDDQHLFSIQELKDLIQSLSCIPNIVKTDLDPFSGWLISQSSDGRFNVGCLFAVDALGQLRVCLHPKLVRSKYETSALHETHMTEADVLTLVTLQPENRSLLSITLQPLICADALFLDPDRPWALPLQAVNNCAECFERTPPDHIDVVSVVTCTPQVKRGGEMTGRYLQWHQEFRKTFVRAASELTRHHYSTFVLSNYLATPGGDGGLSGVFLPIPLGTFNCLPFVVVSVYGRSSQDLDNAWSLPTSDPSSREEWSSFGYIASLNSLWDSSNPARMLGFTVGRLPRHMSHWGRSTNGLTDFQLRKAILEPDSNRMVFLREGSDASR